MDNPNLAAQYYRDERTKTRVEHPWLYWVIVAGVSIAAIIAMVLA